MAHIPVEKKSGTPWWVWLLALLLIGGVIWLFAEMFDDEPDEDDFATTEVIDDPVDTTPPVLTSLSTLLSANNPTAYFGRRVDVDDIPVTSLAGDSTFWVYPDGRDGERIFVVLRGLGESESGPGTGADGVYNVDDSEVIDIEGTVMDLGPNDPSVWGLRGADASMVAGQRFYIQASELDT